MEAGLTKQQIISELTRSTHGALASYVPIAKIAGREDPEFLAHLIAWNEKNGVVRDSKVALPVASLAAGLHDELAENSLAHLALLDPRNLERAYRFTKEVKPAGQSRAVTGVVRKYLKAREDNQRWFIRSAMQHRKSLKSLYALTHTKPGALADDVLFKGKKVGVFKDIAELAKMDPKQAAAVIMGKRIPFLVAIGALGARAKDSDVVLALIERMSPTELVTNTKMLERLGVKTNPALRAAYENGLKKVAESGKQVLKTTRAAEQMTDAGLKAKLQAVQEKQLDKLSVEGDWLVLGDKSGSMQQAIETARLVSATLARMVKGAVTLTFFDISPRAYDVTGKTYDEIMELTKHVRADGGTSIGCGLDWALQHGAEYSGVAIVTDGGENRNPYFADVYRKYCEKFGKDVPVYVYLLAGSETNRLSGDYQVFDLRNGVDYHSLPNLVQTMRANRYSLIDQIMETPLLTLEKALHGETK